MSARRGKPVIRLCLVLAACAGGVFYFWQGPTGTRQQRILRLENEREKKEVAALEEEIKQLQQSISVLKSDPVASERIMREDLQMSYTNEYVYLLR